MKVLVVGSGAREHALAWKCMQSSLVERVYCAPGNGGTGGIARNVPIQPDDVVSLQRFAARERLGLVVLGPESAVQAGVGDALRDSGFPVFGPNRGAGHIETSKAFAKELMAEAGIPTASFGVFDAPDPARAFAREHEGRVAVKADGLAFGKGVIVCSGEAEADAAIERMLVGQEFGKAGLRIVVEARLEGREVSFFALTDGTIAVPLVPARDYKRALDGDEGGNTGGMGSFSPVPEIGTELTERVMRDIVVPAIEGLRNRALEYRGVLYVGLMLTTDGPQVLEFNARFGDPEAEVILPRLDSDLVPYLLMAARGTLGAAPELEWSDQAAVGVVVASGGYPEHYSTGYPIEGLTSMGSDVIAFHAGTRYEPGLGVVTAGGRVLTLVALGSGFAEARERVLAAAGRIRFPGAFFRTDIAQQIEGREVAGA